MTVDLTQGFHEKEISAELKSVQTKTNMLSVGRVLQGGVTGLTLMEKSTENLSWEEFSFLFFFPPHYILWPTCNVPLDGAFNLLHSVTFVLNKFCNHIVLMCIPLE